MAGINTYPPPPPPQTISQQTATTYYSDDRLEYGQPQEVLSPPEVLPIPTPPSQSLEQHSQSQHQHQQLPPFAKANIQPLIDSNPSIETESPSVEFNNNHINDYAQADPVLAYASPLSSSTRGINLRYQLLLDKISPHWKARWTFSLIALVVFLARVIISQGWYVICYALAIYYLNLLIGFISPRVDPSLASGDYDDEDSDAGPMLPTSANDEFKPFIRRVPEFKFWISGTKATLLALFTTLFNIFDVPVFWPILLIYFIILFACTMRQQIKHMIRYSYVPWDSGKKKYFTKNDASPTTV